MERRPSVIAVAPRGRVARQCLLPRRPWCSMRRRRNGPPAPRRRRATSWWARWGRSAFRFRTKWFRYRPRPGAVCLSRDFLCLPAEHLLSAAAGVAAFFRRIRVVERRLNASAAVWLAWRSARRYGRRPIDGIPARWRRSVSARLWRAAFTSVAVAPALVDAGRAVGVAPSARVAALWYAGGILARVAMVAESWGVASWDVGAVVGSRCSPGCCLCVR